jgi:hypothetical protein
MGSLGLSPPLAEDTHRKEVVVQRQMRGILGVSILVSIVAVGGCGTLEKERVSVNIPAGTQLDVEIAKKVSSESATVGDLVEGRLATPLLLDGRVVLAAGSTLVGRVTEAVATKKIGGQARLGFSFETLELDNGDKVAIHSTFVRAGKDQKGKDAATIGGAAAGGALVGAAAKKKNRSKGAAVGAIVGGAVGTAIAANNEGEPVVVPSGTVILIELQRGVEVTVAE